MPSHTDVLIKAFFLAVLGFLMAFLAAPVLIKFLYRQKLGKQIRDDGSTPIFSALHEKKRGTPTMGALLVSGTVCLMVLVFWINRYLLPVPITWLERFNFLSRQETWLPLGAFFGASLVGLIDDFLDARSLGYKGRGIRFRYKVILYILVASIGAWWFYSKLLYNSINVPFVGDWTLGWLYVPIFILIVVGTSFAVNQTDGLDGLAGGTLFVSFVSYGFIAFATTNYEMVGFISLLLGALLAFLWFNIFPAKFFMGDTGSMGMGVLLAILAHLTDTLLLLPFFGFIFLLEALSYFIQLFWRLVFKRKFFLSAPLHHHLEALGWPEAKITMRFWVISWVFSIIGMIIFLLNK